MNKLIIYNQSSYFFHICDSLYNSLKPLFNDNEIIIINCTTDNNINIYEDNDNIYLTFIPFNKLNIDQTPSKYIIYNFEQFTTDKNWSDTYIDFFKKAIYVFDYSLINTNKLIEYNINAFFLPYTSTNKYIYPELETIKKDIDVLFIGNLNNRRKEWLKKISNSNINLKIVTNLFYEKSIEYFARSKIVLNVHYYKKASILEVTRIIPALVNKCIVITEDSDDPYYNIIYNNIIKITTINNVKDDIINILDNYNNIYLTNTVNFTRLNYINDNLKYKLIISLIKKLNSQK